MPYGIPKDIGGDSKENTEWMERCVSRVMKSGKDKSSAIAICKKSLIDRKKAQQFIFRKILYGETIPTNYKDN